MRVAFAVKEGRESDGRLRMCVIREFVKDSEMGIE